ncbi:MAG: CDP-alcohol phosphatidyltransferase family protein [Pseudomonadota bacterium]
MEKKRVLRYLAPNLVTLASLAFGMLAVGAAIDGYHADAAWFVIFSVLTDKLDGFVARLVKGASELGVQLDSFADFLNFGVAPAVVWYAFLSRAGDLPFSSGIGELVLVVACFFWVLAVTFRLARYNVVGSDPACRRVFFGVPTTLVGGTLMAFFLTCLKYGSADMQLQARASFVEPRLFTGLRLGPLVWEIWPALMMVGAFLMVSTVKVPKLGPFSRSRALTVFVFANVLIGYAVGFARHMPEYLCLIACLWIAGSLVWGQLSTAARGLKAPAVFPRTDPPEGKMPSRPEEDIVVEEAPLDAAGSNGDESSSATTATAAR